MNVLLSIKPKYAEAILSGFKKYEFRRKIFKRKDIRKVYLYSNSNIKRVVGFFEINRIIGGSPEEIWDRCYKYGGISKEDFFRYFNGTKKGFAIEIKNVHKFNEPIDPHAIFDDFIPPQSFYYISYEIEEL